MAPNTTTADETIQQFEKLNLKKLAREVGCSYQVFPKETHPPLQPFEHIDPGHLGDPAKKSLYDNAEKIFDVTPCLGTEIHGIQLNEMTDQQKNDLALLAAERGVVFFRDQKIDPYQAVELGRHFGRLHVHQTFGYPPNLPELISVFYNESDPDTTKFFRSKSADEGWHSDITFEEQPAGLTFLKMDTIPEVGGDTLWASAYEAYDRLSEPMQKFLEGLEAIHTGMYHANKAKMEGVFIRREFIESKHPVIRTHPVTGWKGLYVQPGFTKEIVGVSKSESDAILKFLYNHISGGHDFQLRFKWTEDTVAVWDNRCTFHCALFDYFEVGRRHGWRVTPCAEKPRLDPKGKSRSKDLAEKKNAKQQQ